MNPARLNQFVPVLFLALLGAANGQTPAPGAGLPPAQAALTVPTAPVSAGDASTGPDQWKLVTGLATAVSYDDNVFIRSTDRLGDFAFQADPDIAVGWGNFRNEVAQFPQIPHALAETGEEDLPRHNYLYADYTPDAVVYAKYGHADALNHDFRLEGRDEEALLQLHGQFNFQYESAPNIDLGRRIDSTYYTADAGADYALTGKLTAGLDAYGNRSEYTGALTTTDTRGSAYLDCDILPKTTLGLGAAYGYLAVEDGSNQTYAQPLLRLKYAPGEKLSFSAQAGEEFRQFQSGIPERDQFVFQLQGRYEPAEGTVLTLSARRQTDGSAEYAGEDMVETIYEAGVRQQILQRTYLGLTGGYMRVNYVRNDATAAITRADDYAYGRVSLARDITTHGSLELSYEHRDNQSSLQAFSFAQNVVTLSATWLFRAAALAVLLSPAAAAQLPGPAGEFAAPGAELKPVATPLNYQISPTDILAITVFQEDDLKSLLRVSNDGAITFPLIGVVPVKGLSAAEAAQAVASRLAKGYLINPQVTVTVMEFSKRRFTVLGSVQKPGSYDMPDQGDTTLLQAIGIAGGYTRIADARKVTLMRKTGGGGDPAVFHFNAKKMAAGDGQSTFLIQPGDVITVPESMF